MKASSVFQRKLDEARHLLRAILREITYLPDDQARIYLRGHALSRFRDYRDGAKSLDLLRERRTEKVKEARKALSHLRRANAGVSKPLMKVLLAAYGRTGKRRHELMRPLVGPDEAPDEARLSSGGSSPPSLGITAGASEHTSGPGLTTSNSPELTEKLRALLRSQIQASPLEMTRANPNPRKLKLTIPEFNSWGEPMPQNRVANMKKKWYAGMLEHVLPPLPDREWENLRDRALGVIRFTGPTARRARAQSDEILEAAAQDSLLAQSLGLAAKPTRTENWRRHTLTSDFMRRRWAMVFQQCPRMDLNTQTGKWTVRWGSTLLKDELRRISLFRSQGDAEQQRSEHHIFRIISSWAF
ncbi:hypothetical protein H2203_008525 [Taxawa tesnikishii (nom. ined.)]|nr:hypothetical protein H2203_008525 [Dothideales sp. JES 119]